MTRTEAIERLAQLSEELGEFHVDLAMMLKAEHRAKVQTFMEQRDLGVTERERAGQFVALDLTDEIHDRRADIAKAEAEVRYLSTVLPYLNP